QPVFSSIVADVIYYVFYVSLTDSVFFFQAEDGIRDATVTGVQTCALPISKPSALATAFFASGFGAPMETNWSRVGSAQQYQGSRSEERRVGKECRCRWWAYH